jgi:hypothetical protein
MMFAKVVSSAFLLFGRIRAPRQSLGRGRRGRREDRREKAPARKAKALIAGVGAGGLGRLSVVERSAGAVEPRGGVVAVVFGPRFRAHAFSYVTSGASPTLSFCGLRTWAPMMCETRRSSLRWVHAALACRFARRRLRRAQPR